MIYKVRVFLTWDYDTGWTEPFDETWARDFHTENFPEYAREITTARWRWWVYKATMRLHYWAAGLVPWPESPQK